MKDINVAVIGIGVVGTSVIKILQENKDLISARAGANIIPIIGVARNIDSEKIRSKNLQIPLTTNINEVLANEDIDIVVELIGGVDEAYSIAIKALDSKKAFVTANKAMLAYHRYDLESRANNIPIGFEASVCGGIPIIKTLRDGLCANHILSLRGIMNGTSNYILSQMSKNNTSFEDALKQAQDLGFAEANALLDINGVDCAHKLLILASLAYGINARLEDILVEGITKIKQQDISFAREFGYEIKLLGIAKKIDNEVELRVHPALIPNTSILSKVDGAMNAISVLGDKVGECLYYGAGAGGDATASSVISDIVEIARSMQSSKNQDSLNKESKTSYSLPMLGYYSLEEGLKLKSKDDIKTKYYIRLMLKDTKGVIYKISKILADNNVSIKTLLQKNTKQQDDEVMLLLSTHACCEGDIKASLEFMYNLEEVLQEPYMIRIED